MTKTYQSSAQTGAPYSAAREASGFVYVSGQVHLGADGKLVEGSIEDRFAAVIARIKSILSEADLRLEHVVQLRIFLTDINELAALNAVYGQYFDHPYPARTSVAVAALPIGATLEIDVVAARP